MGRQRLSILLAIALLAAATQVLAQRPAQGGRGGKGRAEVTFPPEVASLAALSLMVGRPTDRAATVSVYSATALEGYIEYGPSAGAYTRRTDVTSFRATTPVEVSLTGLTPDARCFYRLRSRAGGATAFAAGAEQSFHTQRAPGSAFTFEIQGDSHPERAQQFDATLYARTLSAAAADHADFYMTIGDDFSVDTLQAVTAQTVTERYWLQRPFLSVVGGTAPVYLVNGNHEQAALCNLNGTADCVAVWAQRARNWLFPQPAPDGFYTGDAEFVPNIGLLRDYYAWTWGDALLVVIDPYWHSPQVVDNAFGGGPKSRDLWGVTLGDAQYQWLKTTLEQSKARYKFVFCHHVLGTGRGGIETAGLCEWGGRDRSGAYEFTARRPGWELPIHQLMARNNVTVFFQGHDHIFVRQQLDGITYQTLPEPADPNYALCNRDAYQSGDALPNSGRVRVSVAPDRVAVEYVRSYLPQDETAAHRQNEVAYGYTIPAAAGARQR